MSRRVPCPCPPDLRLSAGRGTASDSSSNSDKDLKNWSSLIGIAIAISGNALIALALNVQRYAHRRLRRQNLVLRNRARAAMEAVHRSDEAGAPCGTGTVPNSGDGGDGGSDAPPRGAISSTAHQDMLSPPEFEFGYNRDDCFHPPSTYLKSMYWWLGQILITVGETGNFLAYGFAPASIVSPLGVVALISNCVIAPIWFHESFRHQDFLGVVVAVGGVVTVVLSANQEETKLAPHDVWRAIATPAFEIYVAITLSLIAILIWASRAYGNRTICIDLGLVGLFGGYTALAVKGVSSMLSSTLFGAFTTLVTYFLLSVLVVTAVLQIRYVNRALQRFDSTQVIPIQFVMFTLCVIIGSAVLYRDFERTTFGQAVKFTSGCLLTFFGVFLITSGRAPRDDEVNDSLSDVEGVDEAIDLADQDSIGYAESPQDGGPQATSASRRSSRSSRVAFADPQGRSIGLPRAPLLPRVSTHYSLRKQSHDPGFPVSESAPLLQSYLNFPDDARATCTPSPALMAAQPIDPQGSPCTPSSGNQPLLPSTLTPRSSLRRQSLRRARTFISPSPLSSTVATVVKDALLGHDDPGSPQQSSLRRIKLSIRASLFMPDDDLRDHPSSHEASHTVTPSLNDDGCSQATSSTEGRSRSRSLVEAIGEILTLRAQRKRRKQYHNHVIEPCLDDT